MNVKEAFARLLGTDEPEEAEVIKAIVDTLGFEQYKAALQRADEVIKALTERVTALETVVSKLAAEDVERVKQFVEDGDWTKDLFTASEAGEKPDDKAADEAKKDVEERQEPPSLGIEAFFGGGK